MKYIFLIWMIFVSMGCSMAGGGFYKTVDYVDMDRFMKKWYVIAGRLTSFEAGAHNAVEDYRWNEKAKRIDINFYYNKGAFDGPIKSIPQKAWIYNPNTNAHWKVRPIWPLKFSYLVIDLAEDYAWTVIGVPNQKYLWIMADSPSIEEETLNMIIERVKQLGYSTKDIIRVPQKW